MKTNNDHSAFSVIDSATGKEIDLALQELWVTGQILPVGAVLQVRHVFKCTESKPVEVIYAFGLPRDAALLRFRIVGEGFSVMSDLKPTAEAVKVYEAGIEAGSLSSLARQYRDGVVNLNVGNIRPGETVAVYLEILAGVEMQDDGLRFRFPFALAPTYLAKARTIEAEPGVGEMELPEEFGDVILPRWMENATGLHRVGFELSVTLPQVIAEIGSPSHAIKVRHEKDGQHRVSLAPNKDVPDRDLVLDVRTQEAVSGVLGGIGKDGNGHFALVVPSSAFGQAEAGPRRIVFAIDRSGSMRGSAMKQARQSVEACLGALSAQDSFGVVAFDNNVECLGQQLMDGSAGSRDAARKFLETVDARGGTDLTAGFLAAAKLLGNVGGDVFVLTDGQVAGTETILAKARTAGIRIHCLGIGSASQDRFLTLLARETSGVSRFLTARERVDMAAMELFASIGRPLARGIRIEAVGADGISFAPEPPQTIFAGHPLVLFGESAGQTDANVRISWDGPASKQQLDVPVKLVESGDAETMRLLQGSRLITDMDARLVTTSGEGAAAKIEAARQAKALEKLSAKYGLASREMALVAVVKRAGDKEGDVPKTMVVPVGMPQDTGFGAYFCSGGKQGKGHRACHSVSEQPMFSQRYDGKTPPPSFLACASRVRELMYPEPKPSLIRRIFSKQPKKTESADDLLLQLASRIEPDGGMPAQDDEERWVATATVLLCFLEKGHTAKSGAFRTHVNKLVAFLKAAPSTAADKLKRQLVEQVEKGCDLSGNWQERARALVSGDRTAMQGFWQEAAKVVNLQQAMKDISENLERISKDLSDRVAVTIKK